MVQQLLVAFMIGQSITLIADQIYAHVCIPRDFWSLMGHFTVTSPTVCAALRDVASCTSKTGQMALITLVSMAGRFAQSLSLRDSPPPLVRM